MGDTISVGTLRKNPTQMLRDVRAGARYTITDHGQPVADVVPRDDVRWVPVGEVNDLLAELGADDQWAREIAEERRAAELSDPWEETP
jgi:prevent-host-death family protein